MLNACDTPLELFHARAERASWQEASQLWHIETVPTLARIFNYALRRRLDEPIFNLALDG